MFSVAFVIHVGVLELEWCASTVLGCDVRIV